MLITQLKIRIESRVVMCTSVSYKSYTRNWPAISLDLHVMNVFFYFYICLIRLICQNTYFFCLLPRFCHN